MPLPDLHGRIEHDGAAGHGDDVLHARSLRGVAEGTRLVREARSGVRDEKRLLDTRQRRRQSLRTREVAFHQSHCRTEKRSRAPDIAGHRTHLVARFDEQPNQLTADVPCRSCDQNHDEIPITSTVGARPR
jgi:hypothetical protein